MIDFTCTYGDCKYITNIENKIFSIRNTEWILYDLYVLEVSEAKYILKVYLVADGIMTNKLRRYERCLRHGLIKYE